MSSSDPASPPVFRAADEEVVRYRAVSSLALVGLLAGLLSPLVLLVSAAWPVPLAAMIVSGFSLWRIALRWPELIGRPAALAGLLLGAMFLTCVPAAELAYRYLVRQQAREFAEIWIESVRNSAADPLDVYKAHHLMVEPRMRMPVEADLPDYYRKNDKARRLLLAFVKEPTMRVLFALGPKAKIRFYETADQRRQENSDIVQQTYAVTYADDHGQEKTFFIALLMQRAVDVLTGRASWMLVHVDGGVRPPGW